jgi:BirA family biotin operon repressor/biotin-[acetyl-CoA-carboxylase] ligase
MALGLAAQHAVAEICGADCDIRWPNDLLLNGRKIAGILVQSADNGALIAGIGVNVDQKSFPEELKAIATSLRIETGSRHSKEELLDRLVAESLRYAELLSDAGKGPILQEFEACSSYARGKSVHVDDGNQSFEGLTAGLDENGFLLVDTGFGIKRVLAGGVREKHD